MSKSEAKTCIHKAVIETRQNIWESEMKRRHLFKIQGKVGKGDCVSISGRKLESIISWLCIGHRLNACLHIINKHPTGKCNSQVPYNLQANKVKYIWLAICSGGAWESSSNSSLEIAPTGTTSAWMRHMVNKMPTLFWGDRGTPKQLMPK